MIDNIVLVLAEQPNLGRSRHELADRYQPVDDKFDPAKLSDLCVHERQR